MPDIMDMPAGLDTAMQLMGSDRSGNGSRSVGDRPSGNLSSDVEPLPPGATPPPGTEQVQSGSDMLDKLQTSGCCLMSARSLPPAVWPMRQQHIVRILTHARSSMMCWTQMSLHWTCLTPIRQAGSPCKRTWCSRSQSPSPASPASAASPARSLLKMPESYRQASSQCGLCTCPPVQCGCSMSSRDIHQRP